MSDLSPIRNAIDQHCAIMLHLSEILTDDLEGRDLTDRVIEIHSLTEDFAGQVKGWLRTAICNRGIARIAHKAVQPEEASHE